MITTPLRLVSDFPVKNNGLVSPYEFCTYEFIESIVQEIAQENDIVLKINTEISLMSLIRKRIDINSINLAMRDFAFRCSSIDMGIFFHGNYNIYPLLMIEKQGKHHHKDPDQKHNDKLKMNLLELANIPLLYEDSPRIGLMKFIEPLSKTFAEVNPYNGRGRTEFKEKLGEILEQQIQTCEF